MQNQKQKLLKMKQTLFKLKNRLIDALPINPEFNQGIIEARPLHDTGEIAIIMTSPSPPNRIELVKSRFSTNDPLKTLKICKKDKNISLHYSKIDRL